MLVGVSAASLRTLEDVLRWAHARGGRVLDVIVQDEFTHDVVVEVDGTYQVFDTT